MKMPTLEQIRSNRNVLFWSLHAAGWAAYGISQYVGALTYHDEPATYSHVIANAALAGFILTIPLRYLYRRLSGRRPRELILSVLISCYVTALALRVIINYSYKYYVDPSW